MYEETTIITAPTKSYIKEFKKTLPTQHILKPLSTKTKL